MYYLQVDDAKRSLSEEQTMTNALRKQVTDFKYTQQRVSSITPFNSLIGTCSISSVHLIIIPRVFEYRSSSSERCWLLIKLFFNLAKESLIYVAEMQSFIAFYPKCFYKSLLELSPPGVDNKPCKGNFQAKNYSNQIMH